MAGKWVAILDTKVLKVGMHVKCCLDMDHPIYIEREDESDDESTEKDWFTAVIYRIREQGSNDEFDSDTIPVDLKRDGRHDGIWHIILSDDTLKYIKIWVLSDWDD